MSLYHDYRPRDCGEIVGNAATVSAMEALIGRERKDIPHSWLFTGPSGCGKTTFGRIVAEELGCKGLDYYEVDSADFNGIETIRDIRSMMQLSPIESKCRVWLLDECHRLSTPAQDALLKALEDTPSHVYFILCTTDPQKLLKTIRNRCVGFEVESLGADDICQLLKEVVECEKKEVPADILRQIAQEAKGSCRAALQVLEKVIDLPANEMVAVAAQNEALGNETIDLCRAIIAKQPWVKISAILKNIEKSDPEGIRLLVMKYFCSILLKQDSAWAFLVMDSFKLPFDRNGFAGVVHACYEAVTEGADLKVEYDEDDDIPF